MMVDTKADITVRHLLCARPEGLKRLSYRQQGPAHSPSGPAVICVHGLTRNACDFDGLGAALAKTGRRVLAPDVLGRGDSDWLADPMGYGVPGYIGDLMGLIARATAPLGQDEVDWVGTSMGGLIGMVLAASPISPLRKLVLNDVGPFIPKAAVEHIASYMTGKPGPVFKTLEAAEAYFRRQYSQFGPMSDDDWASLTRDSIALMEEGGGWRLHYDPAIGVPIQAVPPADADMWALWDQITCPVLVLRGAQSGLLLPETAAEMIRRGPKCSVHEVPGVGHTPTFTTAEINQVVADFLSEP